jgi:hypothetical protein
MMALDGNVSTKSPLYVEIHEEDGERIEVYLG